MSLAVICDQILLLITLVQKEKNRPAYFPLQNFIKPVMQEGCPGAFQLRLGALSHFCIMTKEFILLDKGHTTSICLFDLPLDTTVLYFTWNCSLFPCCLYVHISHINQGFDSLTSTNFASSLLTFSCLSLSSLALSPFFLILLPQIPTLFMLACKSCCCSDSHVY